MCFPPRMCKLTKCRLSYLARNSLYLGHPTLKAQTWLQTSQIGFHILCFWGGWVATNAETKLANQESWRPSLEHLSCLCLSGHKQAHTAARTYSMCFPPSNVQVNQVQVIIPCTEFSLSWASYSKSTNLVADITNWFPHFVFLGEVGGQEMWKPSWLTRSFGGRALNIYHAYAYQVINKHTPRHTRTACVFQHRM